MFDIGIHKSMSKNLTREIFQSEVPYLRELDCKFVVYELKYLLIARINNLKQVAWEKESYLHITI